VRIVDRQESTMSEDDLRAQAEGASPEAALAAHIRRRRSAAGLSQAGLANLVGYSREYVSRAERPSKGLASAELIRVIDTALHADGALIAHRAQAHSERMARRHRGACRPTPSDDDASGDVVRRHPGPGTDVGAQPQQRVPMPDIGSRKDHTVERRDFLKFGVTVGVGAAAAPNPTQLRRPDAAATITADDVAALRHRLQRLRKVDEVLGGADSYSLYAAEVNRTHELLKGPIAKSAVRVQLVSLYAEQAQQAGWAAFDAGWDDAAADLYRLSFAAAEDAGDHGTASNALALRAYQLASSSRPDIGLTRQSLTSASRPDVHPRVRALVHDRAAWTFALVGEAKEAAAALAVVEEQLQAPADAPTPGYAEWVDATELQIIRGRTWTELKRPMRAIGPLEAAIGDLSDRHARDKALYSS
jgi:transcriptional regulator with XRE-family HTH domain